MNYPITHCRPALLLIACALFAGCSKSPVIPTGEVHGTITLNGKPVQGVSLTFVPESPVRPSLAITDAQGKYAARFVSNQSGVALGPCVVELAIYRGDSPRNYLPTKFNSKAADNPDFQLNVTESGLVFDYDIVYEGTIPPP